MSKIGEFVTAVNAAFDKIDAGLETANTAASGISDDVTFLKDTITQLQNNPGPISPEDQALLDAAQARVNGLATKSEGLATALDTLDDATERPTLPPA